MDEPSDVLAPDLPGPLTRIGDSPQGTVWRTATGEIAKCFVDRDHGQRAAAVLACVNTHGQHMVVPSVLATHAHGTGWCVVLSNVRTDRDPRCDILPAAAAVPAARLLARVHQIPWQHDDPEDWPRMLDRWKQHPHLPGALRQELEMVVPIGDAFCHQDVHPSNWITVQNRPVGLLDWAQARRADPEWDLAGLLMAVHGGVEHLTAVCDAWMDERGQAVDVRRVALFLWCQLENAASRFPHKTHHRTHARAVAARLPVLPPLHGGVRVGRLVEEVDGSGRWRAMPEDAQNQLYSAMRRAGVCAEAPMDMARFGGHACNDVVRLWLGDRRRVLKVYNKPVQPWLFSLERALARRLDRRRAQVLAPLSLPCGGHVARLGSRPAALYPDVGDKRLGNKRSDIVKLAHAHAGLHAVTDLDVQIPALRQPLGSLLMEHVREAVADRVSADVLDRVEALWQPYEVFENATWGATLPNRLLHGSLSRDHTAVPADGGGLVVFDLEKAVWGPAIIDVVRTAAFVGYRGNDETLDPGRFVLYLREYHRHRPLEDSERALVLPLFLRALVHDIKALGQDQATAQALQQHIDVLFAVVRNSQNLQAVIAQQLSRSV